MSRAGHEFRGRVADAYVQGARLKAAALGPCARVTNTRLFPAPLTFDGRYFINGDPT